MQKFGGSWSKIKLEVIQKYLSAYTTALKNQPFGLHYIDGFAGTGWFETGEPEQYHLKNFGLLNIAKPEQTCKDGSAKIALKLNNPFDKYYFIENDCERFQELKKLQHEFPHLADRMNFENGDANKCVTNICRKLNRRKTRVVMFLDPFGLQTEWTTIKSIADTKVVDLWFLFPISAVNRMLPRRAEKLTPEWANKLDRVFGSDSWRDVFYCQKTTHTIFNGDETRIIKDVDFKKLTEYVVERLSTVFPGVAEDSPVLCTDKGQPLFLLCFAVSNPRAKKLALKIARDIIKKIRWP